MNCCKVSELLPVLCRRLIGGSCMRMSGGDCDEG